MRRGCGCGGREEIPRLFGGVDLPFSCLVVDGANNDSRCAVTTVVVVDGIGAFGEEVELTRAEESTRGEKRVRARVRVRVRVRVRAGVRLTEGETRRRIRREKGLSGSRDEEKTEKGEKKEGEDGEREGETHPVDGEGDVARP